MDTVLGSRARSLPLGPHTASGQVPATLCRPDTPPRHGAPECLHPEEAEVSPRSWWSPLTLGLPGLTALGPGVTLSSPRNRRTSP